MTSTGTSGPMFLQRLAQDAVELAVHLVGDVAERAALLGVVEGVLLVVERPEHVLPLVQGGEIEEEQALFLGVEALQLVGEQAAALLEDRQRLGDVVLHGEGAVAQRLGVGRQADGVEEADLVGQLAAVARRGADGHGGRARADMGGGDVEAEACSPISIR